MSFERLPAEEAYSQTTGNRASKWPDRASGRIAPICLPTIQPGFSIARGASIFTMGSCFARHIEFALADQGLTVPTLGFRVPQEELWAGTGLRTGLLNKYTPFSMLNEIDFILNSSDGSQFLIETGPDQWWDGQLHTTESVSFARGIKRRQKIRELYDSAIRQSAVVIITLGLIEAWWDEDQQLYLNETVPRALVQRHPGRFFFEVLSVEKTLLAVRQLIEGLRRINPAHNTLLTVSPVPFVRSFDGRDAIVANGYSKAALRVAAEVASRDYSWVDYYPSYESVTSSERNVAWEDDLVHVRPDMVKANVERMVEAYLEPEASA